MLLVTQTHIQLLQDTHKKKASPQTYSIATMALPQKKKRNTRNKGGDRVRGIYPQIGKFPNHRNRLARYQGKRSTPYSVNS